MFSAHSFYDGQSINDRKHTIYDGKIIAIVSISGNVSVTQGRMTTKDDLNACVISEELANRNQLKVGDHLQFHSVKNEEPVQEATGRITG